MPNFNAVRSGDSVTAEALDFMQKTGSVLALDNAGSWWRLLAHDLPKVCGSPATRTKSS